MIKKWLLWIILTFPLVGFAQINNLEFKKVLDSMYNHTVPLITVDSLKYLKAV